MLMSDVLLLNPTYGRAKAGRLARTYIQQLCEDTECSPEDLLEAMNDRESGKGGSGISVLAARHDDDQFFFLFLVCHLFVLTLITSGRSSGLHPVSSHSCCMYV